MSDLTYATAQNTRATAGEMQVTYREHNGAVKAVRWLSMHDAIARAVALKARGYAATVEPMPHVAALTFTAAA